MMLHQSGQTAVEFILMSVVIITITLLIAREVRNSDMIASMVTGPFERIEGMVENGVWLSPKKGKEMHPNYLKRSVSLKGDRDDN
tara:strand:+ start:5737 stop:5991 length:255 start_codon:yes stop_codon:yes gene_type:complete